MKKFAFLGICSLISLCLLSCGETISNTETSTSDKESNSSLTISDSSTNSDSTSSNHEEETTSSEEDSSTSQEETTNGETSTSQDTTTEGDSCEIIIPEGKNPYGDGQRMPLPCNKNNLITIGNDNKTMSSFKFYDKLPEYFRHIYGNNFSKGDFYGSNDHYGLKFSNYGNAKLGFQTPFFISSQKLEIRFNIGNLHQNSKGNLIDKDEDVIRIWAFDINGAFLRETTISNFDMGNQNSKITKYINGNDVSYLEFRAFSMPHKSSQAYNFELTGIDLIARNYPYDGLAY